MTAGDLQHRGMSTRQTVLFALAGAVAVGNLYYTQPLLHVIGVSLHTDVGHAGFLVTATQIGYSLGVLLLVPLGDSRDRRRLIPTLMLLSAAALTWCAVAPTLSALAVASLALGLTTVSGQLLTPLAGDLADDRSRGRVVGIVVSGLVTGILVSRIAGGVIAGAWGWRAVFAIAAAITAALALVLAAAVPRVPPTTRVAYPKLLGSVLALAVREPTVRVTLVLGALGFAMFTMFWTALTFLLSGAPYDFTAWQIGLVGVAGLVGALAAQGAGRLHDRGRNVAATGACWCLGLAAWAVAAVSHNLLIGIIVAAIVLDVSVQGLNILNQSRVFVVAQEARSRVNTAYVTANFVGGTGGSLAAAVLWSVGGWSAITVAGAAMSVLGCAVWAAARRGALRASRDVHTS